MGFIKKYAPFLIAVGIIALFLFIRFYHLLGLPIFTDEAIYIRWSQIAKQDAAWRFISLTDGKQPMYVWIAMTIMRFVEDPLLAGRLVSVFAGFFSMVGLFFLGRELFKNKWVGVVSSFLYAIYPFAVVYDRMALYDSLVGMFVVWGLYLTVLFVRNMRLDLALILGMVIGAGMLTKTNAFATLYLQPVALLLFDWSRKHRKERLVRWALYAIVIAILSNAMYAMLRLSPFFYIVAQKNTIFFYPFSEWIKHPFTFFYGNIHALVDWFLTYMTLPFVFLIIGAFFINKKFFREKILLVIWFVVPFLYLAFFGNNMYPRFIFFMTLPLLLLVAYFLVEMQKAKALKNKFLYAVCFLVFIFLPVRSTFLVLTDFGHAPIPRSDIGQYYAGWPSGVGVAETVSFLSEKAKNKKIYVVTEGSFGLMPYALEIYLVNNPNIKIDSLWPVNEAPPKELLEKSKVMPVYVVFYQSCPACKATGIAPDTWPVKEIFQLQKQEENTYYTLYELTPR